MEMVSSSWSLLGQGPKRNLRLLERFSFEGCLSLDHKNIITEFQIRALSLASILVLLRHKGWLKLDMKKILTQLQLAHYRASMLHNVPRHQWLDEAFLEVLVSYPGDEIPKWFTYQKVGCSITIRLLPLWYSPQNFMGLAFCFVVENSHNDDLMEPVDLNWEIHLKTNYDFERSLQFFSVSNCFGSNYDSNHVLMATYLDMGAVDFDSIIEISFRFSFDDQSKRKIKRCGIGILCLQDTIEIGIIHDQYVFVESNVVTNEPQPNGFWRNTLYPLLSFQVFPSRQQLCEKLLSSKIKQRHNVLWLLLVWDIFPVREVANRQMDVADITCPLCGMVLESATHLFLYCKSVCPLWFMSRWGLRTDSLFCDCMVSFLEVFLFGVPNSNKYHFGREFLQFGLRGMSSFTKGRGFILWISIPQCKLNSIVL